MNNSICFTCKKSITSQKLNAMGKLYHPEHFQCVNCESVLNMNKFYEKEGKPYCENCNKNMFSALCAHCNQPINGKSTIAIGKKWHPEHFVCTTCKAPFTNGQFFEIDGYPYCKEHVSSSNSKACGKCNQTIEGNYVNAIGKTWHQKCFTCNNCSKAFSNGQFFEMNGMPYCDIHYYNTTGSMCSACNKPVTGKAVNALGKTFHPEHFVCGFCFNPLKGNYNEKQGKAYCYECHNKLYG
eukprot:TRINITY_DN12110_c0_g1_i1.p1 TRINITY_DN12110_c0_g1~~TRINITY_DN12110_c0_g1_i1.p1  ORF type:complete len:239 (+),score=29.73 TRINITY_DN12110_c0_g1_i1:23-739(+)